MWNIFSFTAGHHQPTNILSLLPLSRLSSRLFAFLQWKYMKSYRTNTRHFCSLSSHQHWDISPYTRREFCFETKIQIFLDNTSDHHSSSLPQENWRASSKFVKNVICLASGGTWAQEWSPAQAGEPVLGRYYINDLVVSLTMRAGAGWLSWDWASVCWLHTGHLTGLNKHQVDLTLVDTFTSVMSPYGGNVRLPPNGCIVC